MKFSESPVMIFFRSMVLLTMLIALPGIAICWNHIPKDLWNTSAPKPSAPKAGKALLSPKKSNESKSSVSVFVPETIPMPLSSSVSLTEEKPKEPMDGTIKQVHENPSVIAKTRDYESSKLRLKALGAKYYQLEKWGNRGELFRFSCFVSPLDRNQYEKYFQAIGADEVTVMESVIAEIEEWQNGRGNPGQREKTQALTERPQSRHH